MKKMEKEQDKPKIPKNELLSYQSKFSLFFEGVSKNSFFDNSAQKTGTPKTL